MKTTRTLLFLAATALGSAGPIDTRDSAWAWPSDDGPANRAGADIDACTAIAPEPSTPNSTATPAAAATSKPAADTPLQPTPGAKEEDRCRCEDFFWGAQQFPDLEGKLPSCLSSWENKAKDGGPLKCGQAMCTEEQFAAKCGVMKTCDCKKDYDISLKDSEKECPAGYRSLQEWVGVATTCVQDGCSRDNFEASCGAKKPGPKPEPKPEPASASKPEPSKPAQSGKCYCDGFTFRATSTCNQEQFAAQCGNVDACDCTQKYSIQVEEGLCPAGRKSTAGGALLYNTCVQEGCWEKNYEARCGKNKL